MAKSVMRATYGGITQDRIDQMTWAELIDEWAECRRLDGAR